jgi:hypothetical protein
VLGQTIFFGPWLQPRPEGWVHPEVARWGIVIQLPQITALTGYGRYKQKAMIRPGISAMTEGSAGERITHCRRREYLYLL